VVQKKINDNAALMTNCYNNILSKSLGRENTSTSNNRIYDQNNKVESKNDENNRKIQDTNIVRKSSDFKKLASNYSTVSKPSGEIARFRKGFINIPPKLSSISNIEPINGNNSDRDKNISTDFNYDFDSLPLKSANKLREILKKMRDDLAFQNNILPRYVLENTELNKISKKAPLNSTDFKECLSGEVRKKAIEPYLEIFIKRISSFIETNKKSIEDEKKSKEKEKEKKVKNIIAARSIMKNFNKKRYN